MMRRRQRLLSSSTLLLIIITTTITFLPAASRGSFLGRRLLTAAAFMGPSDQRDEPIVLPEREYGYASTPFTWSELVEIIETKPNLAKLSRSVQQQSEYIRYTRAMLREWQSVYDHILCSKFNFDKRLVANPDLDGRNETLWQAYPPLDEVRQARKVLTLNDFPYYMADGIDHWCLWALCQDITEEELQDAKEELRSMYKDALEFLCWRNPPHLKSLPDIDHYHILIKKTGQPYP